MNRRNRAPVGRALLFFALATAAGCGKPQATLAPTKPAEVVVDHPTVREVTDHEDFTGRTEAIATVDIRARVTGYLDKANFKDGTDVKQGDVLFEIDPRTYRAEVDRTDANAKQAEARLGRANSDYKREMSLVQRRAVSQEEVDRVIDDRSQAQAAVASAVASRSMAELNYGFTKVSSPLAGRISRRLVDPGNLVKADDTMLTTIVSIKPIYAYFDIDERTLLRLRRLNHEGKIKSARDTTVNVLVGLADESGFSYSGTINFIDNRIEAATGTLRVRAEIKNEKGFLSPGFFVRIRLPVGVPHQAILVPEQALGTDQGQRFLYILNDKDEVVYRKVEVGLLADKDRVIEQGVSTSDRVIVSGVQRVRPGAKTTPKMAEPAPKKSTAPLAGAPTRDEPKESRNPPPAAAASAPKGKGATE